METEKVENKETLSESTTVKLTKSSSTGKLGFEISVTNLDAETAFNTMKQLSERMFKEIGA